MAKLNGAEQQQLELSIRHAQAVYGTDFDVIVEVRNTGEEDTPIRLTISSSAITYTSLHLGECQKKSTSLTVPAQKGEPHSKPGHKRGMALGCTLKGLASTVCSLSLR